MSLPSLFFAIAIGTVFAQDWGMLDRGEVIQRLDD